MIVTIDGPAGAGKSSAARGLAIRLGFRFLDTGATYRTVALAAVRRGLDWDDSEALARLAREVTITVDESQVTLDGDGARLVAEGILDLLDGDKMPDAVGGMAIGADPITAAVITMSAVRGTPIRGFMVRKESKGHGTNQYVEGPVQPGDEVVIVEDVVTTGGTLLKVIDRVEAAGFVVGLVVTVVDRQEGGAEILGDKGYPLKALFTRESLLS